MYRPKVLYIEDYPETRELMKLSLRERFEFYEAGTVQEGIQLLQSSPMDIILIDLHLPDGIDGYKGTHMIRAMAGYEVKPIIAITAFYHRDIKKHCIEQGCTDVITKPFHPFDVADAIMNIWTHCTVERPEQMDEGKK